MRLRLTAALVALVGLLPLLASAQSLAEQSAFDYMRRDAARHGLSTADVTDLVATDAVRSRRTGATSVYLHQAVDGVPVTAGQMTVTVRADGRIAHAAGRLVPGLAARVSPATASVDAASAALAVARAVEAQTNLRSTGFAVVEAAASPGGRVQLDDGGIARLPALARLVWADPTPETTTDALHLAWETTLYLTGSAGDWYGLVDARTGAVLLTRDQLVREAQAHFTRDEAPAVRAARAAGATHVALPRSGSPFIDAVDVVTGAAGGGAQYRVYAYPAESPNHVAPLPPADGRALVVDPHDVMASPFGWHDTNGAAGAEFTITHGNNTSAYADPNDDDTYSTGDSPDCGATLNCDFPINLAQQPATYRTASTANLFYWSNVVHDVMWQYGFDEASGNFQVNNYGNGGAGNDPVNSEAQDAANTGGNCNANFGTPPDGQRPRMQMYLCTIASPAHDGSFDTGVIAHEYGHGISNRMTGGPSNVSCLQNSEQMGEGWSDLFGLLLSMRDTDTGVLPRGVGTYLLGEPTTGPGVRPARYSTNFAVNNYTYARSRTAVVPHGVGHVWATIVWEVVWELTDEYGFDANVWNASGTAGNQIALQLITEGLRLQPCNPGFVDGRDAILAADVALYNGDHTDLLWAAFARRGLGIGASQGSSNSNGDNVEDFAEPEAVAPSPVTDLAATPNGDFAMLSFTATGDDGPVGTATSYDVRYATSPIVTDADFAAATQATGEPAPQAAGAAESFMLTGLSFSTTYYVALKVADNSFNISELSNVVQTTTFSAPVADIPTTPVVAGVAGPGDMTTATVTLGNTGPSDLRYSVSLAGLTRRPAPVFGESTPEPEAFKDAPEPTPGPEVARGSGGPDDYGYTWTDSNEPGGPAFDWIDISTTGTSVSLGDDDDATVALPFAFPFYGVDQNNLRIVSNGWIGFGGSSVAYSNTGIPDASEPNHMLAAYWDDLNPSDGGSIRYRDMGDGRFVVSWLGVPHYSTGGAYTFQAILYASGQIVYQYQTITHGTPNSATVGIESAGGSDGLEVVQDAPYVTNNLAIRFSSLWVDADPAAGLVPAGGSSDVTLTFDATGLAIGAYQAEMVVTTNDPSQPVVTIPVTFNVGTVAVGDPAEAFEGTHLLSQVFPNPAAASARMTLAVAEAQAVRVELYDALGRRVALVHDGDLAARQAVTLDLPAQGLAAGAYVVRLTGAHFADTRRFTVTR